ncbi:MAG TPA: hypothetical protein DCQ93_01825 [Bacteroidetes bacterium]|nr:hypothetical protein [Bacteroidota bacterium]
MKKIIFVWLFTFELVTGFIVSKSKAQNCIPVTNLEFMTEMKVLNGQTTDQLKLNNLNLWLRGKCVQSGQAKSIALLFQSDDMRLQYCYAAYSALSDKENYYALFDAFNALSYAFLFYDFVNENIAETNTVPIPDSVKLFPDLNYPSPVSYKGMTGCNLPMSDNDFNLLVKPVVDAQGDVNRATAATQFVQSNCVSMAQLMMLSTLIQLDLNRQKFMKQNFTKCYDMENYPAAAQVFSTQSYRDDWNAFAAATIKSLLPPPPPPVIVCTVSEQDMNAIITQLNNQSFASTKVSTAKTILAAKKCFTVSQIKSIVKTMSFENDKLDVAKYAYDYCIDKQNYYQLSDVFDFSSSTTDLMNFLKGKQ